MNIDERMIVFLAALALMAWQGLQRGMRAQLMLTVFILLGSALSVPELLGSMLLRIISFLTVITTFLFSGGLGVLISGDFNRLGPALVAAKNKPPLVPIKYEDLFLFAVMVLVILAGFTFVSRIKKRSNPWLGLLIGLFNGLLVTYALFPDLPQTVSLPPIEAKNPLGYVSTIISLTAQLLLAPFQILYNSIGVWVVALTIVLIVLFAVGNLGAERKG